MTEEEIQARHESTSNTIKIYTGWSAGASLIPAPLVDLAAVTGVQIKMVHELSKAYDIPFSRNAVKTIIASLLGSALPATLARGMSSLIKAIPGVGSILGSLSAPVFTTASTYAVGKVFVKHFEMGGNLLDFDTEAMRGYFKEEFESSAAAEKSGGKSQSKAAA